jgi:glycosyltransferase involved in cell wall biosynthesis
VVASAIGQLHELVRDGETGLLVEPGDPAALAAAIRRLAGDGDLRRRMGATAAAEARHCHAWTRRAAEILAVVGAAGGARQ